MEPNTPGVSGLVKTSGLVAFVLLALALPTALPATGAPSPTPAQGCPLDSDPPRIGPLVYDGDGNNKFEYEADAGTDGRSWYYRVAVKNLGAQPLTLSWPKPNYFRRGIRPKAFVPGQCLPDGNPPNQDLDRIMYGPNTQFPGPFARFYRPAPSAQTAELVRVVVSFDSELGPGRIVSIRLSLESIFRGFDFPIEYMHGNNGSPVRVKWGAVSGQRFYNAATAQLGASNFDAKKGLLILSDKRLGVQVFGGGASARRVLQVLEVSTLEGIVIYRDLAPGITFDDISPFKWP